MAVSGPQRPQLPDPEHTRRSPAVPQFGEQKPAKGSRAEAAQARVPQTRSAKQTTSFTPVSKLEGEYARRAAAAEAETQVMEAEQPTQWPADLPGPESATVLVEAQQRSGSAPEASEAGRQQQRESEVLPARRHQERDFEQFTAGRRQAREAETSVGERRQEVRDSEASAAERQQQARDLQRELRAADEQQSRREPIDMAKDAILAGYFGCPTAAPQEVDDEDLIDILAGIQEIFSRQGVDAPIPCIHLVGPHNSGKSMLFQRFLGQPSNFVADGRATRRPLETRLVKQHGVSKTTCSFSPGDSPLVPIDIRSLWVQVRQANLDLAARNSFSAEPCRCELRSESVSTFVVRDYPGFEAVSVDSDGTEDMRPKIFEVVKEGVESDPGSILLVVLEPVVLAQNKIIEDLDALFGCTSRNRSRWTERAVFVMTKADMLYTQYNNAREIMEGMLKPYEQAGLEVFYVSTTKFPDEVALGDAAQGSKTAELFVRMQKHLQMLDEYEDATIRGFLAKLAKNRAGQVDYGELTQAQLQRFGFRNLRRRLEGKQLEVVQAKLPSIVAHIEELVRTKELRLKTIHEQQRERDLGSLVESFQHLKSVWANKVLTHMEGANLATLRLAEHVPQLEMTLPEELVFEVGSEFRSLDIPIEETSGPLRKRRRAAVTCLAEEEWRALVAEHARDIVSAGCSRGGKSARVRDFETHCIQKQVGGAQFRRMLQFMRETLCSKVPNPSQYSEHHIISLMGHLAGTIDQPQWDRPIAEMVKDLMVRFVHPSINWFVKYAGSFFKRLLMVSLFEIKHWPYHGGELARLANIDRVAQLVLNRFEEDLRQFLVDAGLKIHNAVRPIYSTLDVRPSPRSHEAPLGGGSGADALIRFLAVANNASGGRFAELLAGLGLSAQAAEALDVAARPALGPLGLSCTGRGYGLATILASPQLQDYGRQVCGMPYRDGGDAVGAQASGSRTAFSFGAYRDRLATSVQDNERVEYFTPATRQPFTSVTEISIIKEKASMVTLKVMEHLTEVLGKQLDYHLFAQFKDMVTERLDGMVVENDELASVVWDPDATARLAEEGKRLEGEVQGLRQSLVTVRSYQALRVVSRAADA